MLVICHNHRCRLINGKDRIAGAKVWNSLPDDVTSAPSLSIFRRNLKTYLFRCCYNTLWYCCTYSDYSHCGPRDGVAA